MRLLYFSQTYTTHDRRFLAKMAESSHEVWFLRLDDDGRRDDPEDLPDRIHALRWVGPGGDIGPDALRTHVPHFVSTLRGLKPDVVHAGPIHTCAFLVALAGFRPLLAMSWGSDILVDARDDERVGRAAKFALERADLVAVDCDAVRTRVGEMVGATQDRFVQFPWGLELERFPHPAQRESSPHERVVLSTRSWAPIYGVTTVVDSFAIAHAADPRLRLELVGDGPLADEVHARIDQHGLKSVVRCLGRLDEVSVGRKFASADVYLSCALSDGTSVSLLEAMANGLPVVVTDAPGNREWVVPDRGGWLAAGGDAGQFAACLLRAVRLTAEQRRAVALFNRKVVDARADWHGNTRRLVAAYASLEAIKPTRL